MRTGSSRKIRALQRFLQKKELVRFIYYLISLANRVEKTYHNIIFLVDVFITHP